MTFIATRGGTEIANVDELKLLLTTLLRVENVGVFLGAGASINVGGKTMAGLWDDFQSDFASEAQWLAENNFIKDFDSADDDSPFVPNVERLVDTLEIALAESRRQNASTLTYLEAAHRSLYKSVIKAAILSPPLWAVDSLDTEGDEVLGLHKSMLQKLVSTRQPGQNAPWVFTTNYDLAVEWACESIGLYVINGFTGLHRRHFSPQTFDLGLRNVQARGEARFGVYNVYLAKLHGSLSWMERDGQVFEMPASAAQARIKRFLEKDVEFPGLMVMPRAAKYMETSGFLFGELFRRFSEFLSKSQATLLLNGYGFGDDHINRLLRSALLNPTLQLVIYFPEFTGDTSDSKLPKALRQLIQLSSPRVTVVGGGSSAYLDSFVNHLPEPLLYDEEMQELRRRVTQGQSDSAETVGVGR